MIGFGVVGTGRMAAQMAGTIAASGEAKLLRVASGTSGRASAFAAAHGIGAHGDLDAMLRDPAVRAIYVAGRNRDHAAVSIAGLEAGKAVLCEKPFACSPAEAEAVIAAARATSQPFMEAMATPFLPAVAEPLARARLGEFGRIVRFEASFGYKVDLAREAGLFAADAGLLRDRMVYPLTLSLFLLGPAEGYSIEMLDEQDARVRLTHAGGARSELAASFARRLGNQLTIESENGRLTVAPPLLSAQRFVVGAPGLGELSQDPILRRAADARARLCGNWRPYGATPYALELQHFCALVRNGRNESAVMTHDVSLQVQHMLAAIEAGR